MLPSLRLKQVPCAFSMNLLYLYDRKLIIYGRRREFIFGYPELEEMFRFYVNKLCGFVL